MFGQRERAVFELARRQEGVVAYAQLPALGFTFRRLGLKLQSGEWIRELPSVARMYWAEPSWMQRVWATALWAGPSGVISHRSAAALLGLDVQPGNEIDVVTTSQRCPAPWVRSRQCRWLVTRAGDRWPSLVHTSVLETLVHLGDVLGDAELERVVAGGVRDGVVSLRALRGFVERRWPRGGHPGAARLERVMRHRTASRTDPVSALR